MKAFTEMVLRFIIAQIIFIIVSLPLIVFPRRTYFRLLYPIFTRLYLFAPKIRVCNLSNKFFDNDEHPVIFASNHKSFADFCYIAKYLKKPFTIMMKHGMTENIFFKFFAWKMQFIGVNRSSTLSQLRAVEKAKKMIMKDKYSLMLFPEGWYHFDKPVGKLKKGIAKLAEETGVKVLPLAIYGIKNTFYKEDKLVWKNVYIKSGKHILFSDFKDRKSFLKELEKRISNLYLEIEDQVKTSKKPIECEKLAV